MPVGKKQDTCKKQTGWQNGHTPDGLWEHNKQIVYG